MDRFRLKYYPKMYIITKIQAKISLLLLCNASFFACIANEFLQIVAFYVRYTCTPCVLLSYHLYSIELSQRYHPSVLKHKKNPLVWDHRHKGPKYRTFYEINTVPFSRFHFNFECFWGCLAQILLNYLCQSANTYFFGGIYLFSRQKNL